VKAKDFDFTFKRVTIGFTFYPYQLTFGFSLRYWPCIFMPSIRIHFLCFKIWVGIRLTKEEKDG